MRFVTLLLCFIFFCGKAHGQTIQENINTRYSPWDVSGFSLISSESDQMNNGGQLSSHTYVGPNYRLNNRERLALKVAFNANTAGYSRFGGECSSDQDMELANPFIEYNNYNVGLLPGIADVFWSGRIYAPLAKSSRRKGRIARYKSNTIITRYITPKLFGEFRNDVSFYHHSKRTSFGTHLDDNCNIADNRGPSNTRAWRMDNWLSLWYRFNSRLSVGGSFMMREQGFNRSNEFETSRQRNGRMREISLFLGPSLRYMVSTDFSFILSFRDVVEYSGFHPERQDDLVELGEFRSRNTELSVLTFYRF